MKAIMNKWWFFLSISSMLFLANACPDKDIDYSDSTITIHNNTDKVVLHYFDFYRYPDTSLMLDNPFFDEKQLELAIIEPNNSIEQEDAWLKYFEQPNTSKVMLYLIDKNVFDGQSWDTIKANYLVLKRYDLGLDDLNRMNWTITYP
jgi:hypothetical protein